MKDSPQEKLGKASKILKILETNIYQATWYAALYERAAFHDNEIGKAFGESFATWGVIKCQEGLHDALVSAVIRIIRGDGENTASLITLLNIIRTPEVIKLLEKQSLEAAEKAEPQFIGRMDLDSEFIKTLKADLKEENKKTAVENVRKYVRELDEMAQEIHGDQQHARVNSHRNTNVSHLAIELNPKKHKRAKWGDAPDLLKKLYPIVNLCSALVTGISLDFEGHEEHARRCANNFWEYAAHIKEKN